MDDEEPTVLGLGLTRRTVMAAGRAGFGPIFCLRRDHAASTDVTEAPDWTRLADALGRARPAALVIAPPTILAESAWLKRLAAAQIAPAAWAAIAGRIAVLAATAVPEALAMLQTDGEAYDIATVQERLGRRFGPAAALPSEIDPMVVATSKDIPVAERRLLHGLVKETDGFMARYFDRRISLQISRLLAPSGVTPTQMTMVSMLIGLCGAPFFLSALWPWQTAGALLLLLHSIVDGCDGELARLKFQETRLGGILDFWGDNVVHAVTFACMAVGWAQSSAATWPLLLGAAAIVGTLGSAGLVHVSQLRHKHGSGPLFTSLSAADGPVARILDAASRRDFLYVVLIFALFGKSSWSLLFASVGAPVVFLLLLVLPLRARLQGGRIDSI
jgi:phosphatidylglycerophosphate synthase